MDKLNRFKSKTCIYLIAWIWLLLTTLGFTTCQIVYLFNKPHFYELELEQSVINGEQGHQQFEHLVNANGYCSRAINSSHRLTHEYQEASIQQLLDFNAHLFIYSTYDFKLSFFLSIEFSSTQLIVATLLCDLRVDELTWFETVKGFRGYEINFLLSDNQTNCIQLIEMRSDSPSGNLKRKINLKIKDPSFASLKNADYAFDFGRVSVAFLFDCNQEDNDIHESSSIINNVCVDESLRSELKPVGLPSLNKSIDSSQAFLQEDSDVCQGDLNPYTCILKYESNLHEKYIIIMQPMLKQFSYAEGVIDMLYYNLSPKIKLRNEEKLSNNIVYKLYPIKDEQINYLGLLRNPNKQNPCARDKSNKHCSCDGHCVECTHENTYPGRTVVLDGNYERSLACSKFIYTVYDFQQIGFVKSFRNKASNMSIRVLQKYSNASQSSKDYLLNRNILPGICVNLDREKHEMNIALVDVNKIGQSSLFFKTLFGLRVYSVKPKSLNNFYGKQAGIGKLHRLELKTVWFKYVELWKNEMIPLNRMDTTYLIELSLVFDSDICSNRRLCPDESIVNNTIQCVECNKLIAYLRLSGAKSQSKREHLCTNGSDNANFAKLLEKLYLSRDDSFSYAHQLENLAESSVLFSSLVPESFRIENLLLPADMVRFESESSLKLLSILLISFSFLILFLVCLFVTYQKIHFKIMSKYKERVIVFYLSIRVDTKDQAILKQFVQDLSIYLSKKFFRLTFLVLGYDTDSKDRVEILMNCDLVFYVCANITELDFICVEQSMKIGQNSFHDDYNRLHFIDQFKKKCIDLVFSTRQYSNEIVKKVGSKDDLESEIFLADRIIKSKDTGNEDDCQIPTKKLVLPSQLNEYLNSLKCMQHEQTHTKPLGIVSKLNAIFSELVFSSLKYSISNRIQNKIKRFNLEKLKFVSEHSVQPSESFSWI